MTIHRVTINDTCDQSGHYVLDKYFEWYWLSVLGPSSVLLVRHLAQILQHHPEVTIDTAVEASRFGLTPSTFTRTITRLVRFGFIDVVNDTDLAVRLWALPLTEKMRDRLHDDLRVELELYEHVDHGLVS